MENVSISLVIPAYNEEAYVGDCLEAVAAFVQSHVGEVIVVDNASTDSTGEIARSYPGVQTVREEQKGLAYARQRGYLESRSDVVVFIDADTRPVAGWIERIREAFTNDLTLACMSGPYQHYDIPKFNQFIARCWDVLSMPLYYALGYMVVGGNLAIRRRVLDAIGGFDQNIEFYGDDAHIGRQAHAHGKVLFDLNHIILASGRRMKAEGYILTGFRYLANYLAIALSGKPQTIHHTDIR